MGVVAENMERVLLLILALAAVYCDPIKKERFHDDDAENARVQLLKNDLKDAEAKLRDVKNDIKDAEELSKSVNEEDMKDIKVLEAKVKKNANTVSRTCS